MHSAHKPSSALSSPEVELQALREENHRLQAQIAATAEHQALAERYQQSQVRFRTVFDNSPLGHKIIAQDLTIRQANPALAQMLGLSSPDELVGRRILEFAHPHHRYDWNVLQEQLWSHKMPSFSLETCLMRPDGSSFWCQVTSVLFPDEAGEMGYTTLEDITARKEAEAALQRLYDAQETVMHVIAHDLKSPLANIQMLVEVLKGDDALLGACPADVQQETRAFLEMIQRACTEANALLQDVLYLGDLDAKRLVKQRLDLNAFLDARLIVYRVAAQQKGIELVQELPAEVVHAHLNPEKFARVLDNLLTNALKFTPAGGRVTVQLRPHAGRARLTVQDTGMGIPAELQEHLFD
ncbi:hypothetical protein B0919_24420 [Hymenobacter sp. CRA2]|nr:hypothetical protein B0919_24420 [Hymenobacter sp. CRA2]